MKKMYAGFFTCLFALTVCFVIPGCEGGSNPPDPAEDTTVDEDIDEEAEGELEGEDTGEGDEAE